MLDARLEFLFTKRSLATSTLILQSGDTVLNFAIYTRKSIIAGQSNEILRILETIDPDRNIFCFAPSGQGLWQIANRPRVRAFSGNPFVPQLDLDPDGKLRATTWSGHIYKIDPRSGYLNLVDWTK